MPVLFAIEVAAELRNIEKRRRVQTIKLGRTK